jgi:hypothetical protein
MTRRPKHGPPVQASQVRLLAGRRSDPFFADLEGTLHGFASPRWYTAAAHLDLPCISSDEEESGVVPEVRPPPV